MRTKIFIAPLAFLTLLTLLPKSATAITANLAPSKDNTLYEHVTGSLSNGAGPGIFSGVTGEDRRTRGLLMFDIEAAVPSDATITDVTLTLNASKVAESFPDTISLARVLTDWGEADSIASGGGGGGGTGGLADSGDATWLHSFSPGTHWTNVGGDFSSTLSAATSVGDVGVYTWSSAQLITDVQEMVWDPHLNYGWGVIGNETFSRTVKRFDSREHPVAANRPLLTIEYDVPGGGLGPDFDDDDDVDGDDLGTWSDAYGSGNGGDADGDNDTDGSDYLAWQHAYTGPAGLQSAVVPEPASWVLALGMLTTAALNRHRR